VCHSTLPPLRELPASNPGTGLVECSHKVRDTRGEV
jgi:hypothetical protein